MNKKIYWGIIAVLSIIIIILGVQLSATSQKLSLLTQPSLFPTQTNPTSSYNPSIPSDSDPTLGNPNATVSIVIYSDPSCPFCAAAAGKNQEVISMLKSKMPDWQAPLPNIIENYVNTGKVKLTFRYFPGHGSGVQAMKIMYCANEQGKFWELHDAVFDNQNIVSNEDKVKDLAKKLDIDITKIDACLDSKKYDDKLDQDTQSGKAADVKGTPAFFINGQLLSGAQPYIAFKEIIDKKLSK